MEVLFSKNIYDKDGDIYDECIMIHLNNFISIRVGDLSELDALIAELQMVQKEIRENY